MARLDFGHSVEGWHIFFRMNEPFRRTTQIQWTGVRRRLTFHRDHSR